MVQLYAPLYLFLNVDVENRKHLVPLRITKSTTFQFVQDRHKGREKERKRGRKKERKKIRFHNYYNFKIKQDLFETGFMTAVRDWFAQPLITS